MNNVANLLEDKIALVTGASSGIGETTALALAQAGASLVLGARRQEEGEAVAQRIREAGGKAVFLRTDVTDSAQARALVNLAESEFGGLDIAFNNAGYDGEVGPITDLNDDVLSDVLDVNVRGIWNALRAQIPAMKKRGGGSIINTSSILGSRAVAGFGPYVASKFALEGLTKVAALEVAKDNIRINAVAPGPTLTAMLSKTTGGHTEAFNGIVAMGRPASTEEIAPAVVFLASNQASYITGHSLPVGGGALAGFVTS